MPKLLDYIKEKGLTHEQVIEILDKELSKPESEVDESTESEIETDETDKPDSNQIEVEIEPKVEEEEIEQISMKELDQKIDDRIRKVLKIKRKVPSKGKIIKPEDIPKDKDVVKKNWFEVLV